MRYTGHGVNCKGYPRLLYSTGISHEIGSSDVTYIIRTCNIFMAIITSSEQIKNLWLELKPTIPIII